MTQDQQRIAHWQSIIEKLTASYQRLDAATTAAIKAGCLDPEGELHESIWGAFEDATGIIDPDGWLDWWLWDNQQGKNAYVAGANGRKPRAIRTAEQMARVIVDFESEP